jgi:hypothetical protein
LDGVEGVAGGVLSGALEGGRAGAARCSGAGVTEPAPGSLAGVPGAGRLPPVAPPWGAGVEALEVPEVDVVGSCPPPPLGALAPPLVGWAAVC